MTARQAVAEHEAEHGENAVLPGWIRRKVYASIVNKMAATHAGNLKPYPVDDISYFPAPPPVQLSGALRPSAW